MMNLAINVHNLNKYFGDKHVVQDVSIEVGEGRITGFLGPNGSGKTTTLRMLCGLLTPDSGEGSVLGMDFRLKTKEIKLQTGYMTQKFSLYDDMTIEENMMFIARVYGLDNRRARVAEAIERLGLSQRVDQLVRTLSGGWKQRLALAACTLHEPKLLLLDEPTAGVDPKARREFWDEIHSLAEGGMTVLVSTHYMDEAERCHDIGYILNGKLIARGGADEIIEDSGLVTFVGRGKTVGSLVKSIAGVPGVMSATAFGSEIHVSGLNRQALFRALEPYSNNADYQWEEIRPSLEDVFIRFMNHEGEGGEG